MRKLTLLLALLLVGAVHAYADQDPAGDARQSKCGTNTYVYAFVTTNSMVPAENAVLTGQTVVTVQAPIEADTCELNSWLQTLTAKYEWVISVDGVFLSGDHHSESASSDLCETVSDTPSVNASVTTSGQHQAQVDNTATGHASADCPGGTSVKMSHNHSFST